MPQYKHEYVTVTAVEGLNSPNGGFLRLSYKGVEFCIFEARDNRPASFSPDYVSLPVRITIGLPYFVEAVFKALRSYTPSFELEPIRGNGSKPLTHVAGTYYADGGRTTIPVAVAPSLWLSLQHTGAHIADLVAAFDGQEVVSFAKWRVRTVTGKYALFVGCSESLVLTEEGYNVRLATRTPDEYGAPLRPE